MKISCNSGRVVIVDGSVTNSYLRNNISITLTGNVLSILNEGVSVKQITSVTAVENIPAKSLSDLKSRIEFVVTAGVSMVTEAQKQFFDYSGVTGVNGQYTQTFTLPMDLAPNIQATLVGGSNTQVCKVVSVTATGFTIEVVNRGDVIGLLPSYTKVSGAAVDVLITVKQ